jgi:ATP-dependent exoDNAse (exonuclease V) alpha subunit
MTAVLMTERRHAEDPTLVEAFDADRRTEALEREVTERMSDESRVADLHDWVEGIPAIVARLERESAARCLTRAEHNIMYAAAMVDILDAYRAAMKQMIEREAA